jgi:DNA-binding NarL/FixJ family response regulator
MAAKISVLIVEDHHVTAEGLTAGLERQEDIKVAGTASTSAEGLAQLRQLDPDVVLLDLHLPDSQSPLTLVEAFRNPDHRAKVIIFTAENRPALVDSMLQKGVSGYLLKSEKVAGIAAAIRAAMTGEKTISQELNVQRKKITLAEQNVLSLLAAGMKIQDIADQRKVSVATVRKQIELLILKLDLASREELITWAVNNGYNKIGPDQ